MTKVVQFELQASTNVQLPEPKPEAELYNYFCIIVVFCSSRSVKIGALEAGYGLAKKGHTITVVSPFRSKKEVGFGLKLSERPQNLHKHNIGPKTLPLRNAKTLINMRSQYILPEF